MKKTVAYLLISLSVFGQVRLAAQSPPDEISLKLAKIPVIKLFPQPPLTPQQAAHIKRLIASLAKITGDGYDLYSLMPRVPFAPVTGPVGVRDYLTPPMPPSRFASLMELIKLGPRAMPFLLEALDDRTPTRLTVKLEIFAQTLIFRPIVRGNPTNTAELQALKTLPSLSSEVSLKGQGPVSGYTVTIGDVCFLAVGQITGRGYEPVGHIGPGRPGYMIVSPSESPDLAMAIRNIWSAQDPAQHLLDSLLIDYSTRGIDRGDGLDPMYAGAKFQISAASRLLYYFPRETASIVADRLRGLKANGPPPDEPADIDSWVEREKLNGVVTTDFIRAVSWCKEPAIQSALLNLFERATDMGIIVSTLRGLDYSKRDRILPRLEALLKKQPEDVSENGNCYRLLWAIGECGGTKAKADFIGYLRIPSINRRQTMADVLSETRPEWAVELLSPLLTDRRKTDRQRLIYTQEGGQMLSIRVCDEVATTLATVRKDLSFKQEGTYENLDRQIGIMKRQLKQGK
jgi:hypothetical protein